MFSAQATPALNAVDLIPNTPPLKAYFAEGESTAPLILGLPSCLVSARTGSFLELYNVDTGFVAGRHGPFDDRPMAGNAPTNTGVFWNTATYPVLNASFTGLYICRTDTGNSTATYQLNVRGKFTLYSSRYSMCQLFLGSSCCCCCWLVHSCSVCCALFTWQNVILQSVFMCVSWCILCVCVCVCVCVQVLLILCITPCQCVHISFAVCI